MQYRMFYQKKLPIDSLRTYAKDDFFINNCNKVAYDLICKDSIKWPNNRLLLVGESCSGKSHLAYIWQQITHGIRWDYNHSIEKSKTLRADLSISSIRDIIQQQNSKYDYKFQIIEDIDNNKIDINSIERQNYELWLCEIINYAVNNNIKLLLTAAQRPLFILKDLQSRINSTYVTYIFEPDIEIVRILIQKYIYDKQLKADLGITDILAQHVIKTNRSYGYIANVMNKIEENTTISSLQMKKITKTAVRNVIKQMSQV